MLGQLFQYDFAKGVEFIAEPKWIESSAGLLGAITGRCSREGRQALIVVFGDPEQSGNEVTFALTAIAGARMHVLFSAETLPPGRQHARR